MSYVATEYSNDQCSYDQETENPPNKKVNGVVNEQQPEENPPETPKTKEPVSELVKEYQKAVGESLLKLCETLITYGKQFSKIKDDNKKLYKSYKAEDKSVELARMWWDKAECDPVKEEIVVPDNIKTLLTVIGFDLGLALVKKAPFIKGEDKAKELLRIANEEPDGLKHNHIMKATKSPQDIVIGDVVDMGNDGKGVVTEVDDTSVTAVSFDDGAEVSEDTDSIVGKLKKVPTPKVGQWVQFANYLHPLWGKVGVLIKVSPEKIKINDEEVIVGIAERLCTVAVLLDGGVLAEVEVALNQIVKAKSEESKPAELADIITKLNRKVETLVKDGAVDVTKTLEYQQLEINFGEKVAELEMKLADAKKDTQASQAEIDYNFNNGKIAGKKELKAEGWVDPITAAELKARADQADTNRLFALENELSTVKTEKESIEQKLNNLEQSYDLTLSELRQVRDRFSGDAEVRVEAQAAKINELNQVIATMSQQLNDFINRPLKDRVQKQHMEPVTSAVRNVMNVLNQQELTAVPA